jgi:hypothetical protein
MYTVDRQADKDVALPGFIDSCVYGRVSVAVGEHLLSGRTEEGGMSEAGKRKARQK